MKLTIAELIVKKLAAAGVKRICGIVGNSLNGLTEALRKQTAVEWALVRHAADALLKDPALSMFAGQVSDSGEGRWTIKAAMTKEYQYRDNALNNTNTRIEKDSLGEVKVPADRLWGALGLGAP